LIARKKLALAFCAVAVVSIVCVGLALSGRLRERYHRRQLDATPDLVFEYVDASARSPRRRAARAFLGTEIGLSTWLSRRFGEHERVHWGAHSEELSGLGSPELLPHLARTVDREVRRLQYLADEEIDNLRTPWRSSALREVLTRAMRELPRGSRDAVVRALQDDDSQLAQTLLAAMPHEEAFAPAFEFAFRHDDENVRSWAWGALVNVGLPATDFFAAALRDADSGRRKLAAAGLGHVLDKRARPAVSDALLDRASAALGAALDDSAPEVVAKAAFSIGRIGHASSGIVTRLEALRSHSEESVALAAELALDELSRSR